jgi:hypothetical protein
MTYNTVITDVREGYDHLPIAGFSNVYKTLAKGASMGAIAGSAYQRDADGNIVIGADGFPLQSNTTKIIGDAIPDYTMKMDNNIRYRNLELNFDLEWRKGGQMWNGTQAVLDYYGRSATSAQQRNTTGYVFNGVTTDGHINTMPVSFYNATTGVEQNRWTRYGPAGIAEHYIQKADYLKVNTAQVTYHFKYKKFIQHLTVSAYANNLFLWTAYKGADPNQLLYDQPNTSGLDFFNLPSARTYGFNISLQF